MKTVLNVRTDKSLKEEAQKIAKDIGIPLSTVVNAYLKEFVRERRVTFTTEPRLRHRVAKRLEQASKDIRTGKNISPEFSSAAEAVRWLNS
ncbi:MAG: type II toxin-antitoxin system RelB/DinJ family antitoxin [Chloroflexi bacterium]|nr:type II toxin-antitoxin system RelB/DinJ family antitoxin [Chloroflexota bacterium]